MGLTIGASIDISDHAPQLQVIQILSTHAIVTVRASSFWRDAGSNASSSTMGALIVVHAVSQTCRTSSRVSSRFLPASEGAEVLSASDGLVDPEVSLTRAPRLYGLGSAGSSRTGTFAPFLSVGLPISLRVTGEILLIITRLRSPHHLKHLPILGHSFELPQFLFGESCSLVDLCATTSKPQKILSTLQLGPTRGSSSIGSCPDAQPLTVLYSRHQTCCVLVISFVVLPSLGDSNAVRRCLPW